MKKIVFTFLALLVGTNVLAVNDLYLKKGDTQPYYYCQITNADDTAFDLTSYTAYFSMQSVSGTTPKIDEQAMVITNATNGYCEYRWNAGNSETATAGTYYLEIILKATGQQITFPTNFSSKIIIRDNFQ